MTDPTLPHPETPAPGPSDRVVAEVDYAPRLGFAQAFHDLALVRSVRVRNLGDEALEGVRVTLRTDPLPAEAILETPSIPAHGSHRFDEVPLRPAAASLAAQAAPASGHVEVVVAAGEDPLSRTPLPLEILPAGTWVGAAALPELLAAFVRPDAPAVEALLADAAGRLGGALDEEPYAAGPGAARRLLEALHGAIDSLGISREPLPRHYVDTGYAVRTPDQVVERRVGTPLDLGVLFAALAERAGLHSLLVLFEEEVLVGAWLEPESFVDPVIDEILRLRKRVDLQSILLLDQGTGPTTFADAEAAAGRRLEAGTDFRHAVDVRAARRARVRALPSSASVAGEAPSLPPDVVDPWEGPEVHEVGPRTRLERWKRKLLDLSLRNRLLNHRATRKTVDLEVPDLVDLAGRLADGRVFQISPRPAPAEPAPEDASPADEAREAMLRREMEAGRLVSSVEEDDLRRRLTGIYRAARSTMAEGGANTLYLAVAFLEWFESPSHEKPRLAPVLLLPLQMTRRSIAEGVRGYRIAHADEEPQLNVTLLQKLQTDFALPVGGLEDLAESEDGLDVEEVLTHLERVVAPMKRWRVRRIATLGLFSFTKYLMWVDLDRRTDSLTSNAVVKHLLETPDQPFPAAGPLPDVRTLDADHAPTSLYLPGDTDSSQLAAILAGAAGRTFVLEGPPGTGKSQTITNLIAHSLAMGKRVLFASEKMAALNVVHRRLERVGLDPFCLELHSNKARKKEVIGQLRTALEHAGTPAPPAWPRVAEQTGEVRDELNTYVEALHREHGIGLSVFEGLERVIASRDAPRLRLESESASAVDASAREALQASVRRYQVTAGEVGDVGDHAWRAVRHAEWGPRLQQAALEVAQPLPEVAETLARATEEFAAGLGREARGASRTAVDAWIEVGTRLRRAPSLPPTLLETPTLEAETERIEGWLLSAERAEAHRETLAPRFEDAILALDLEDVRRRLERSTHTFWPFSWWRARRAKKALKRVARGRLGKTQDLIADVDRAIDRRQRLEELAQCEQDAAALLGPLWKGPETDAATVRDGLAWATAYRQAVRVLAPAAASEAAAHRAHFVEWAARGRELLAPDTALGRTFDRLVGALTDADEARSRAEEVLALDPGIAWGAADDPAHASRVRSTARAWLDRPADLRPWCGYHGAREQLRAAGWGALPDGYEGGSVSWEQIPGSFQRTLHAAWTDAAIEAEPVLRRFRGREQEDRQARYRELDRDVQRTARDVVRSKLGDRLPRGAAAGSRSDSSEMGVLYRELMRKRHMPLRKLFEKIPNALSLLKPCMLMSPLSVAQYLGPDFPPFDLVVFDEASQIPPWDAVGVIARGTDLIVVGDSKQLPPTTFFDRTEEDDEDVLDDDIQDMESILDECVAARLPRLHLDWHYRSRHESLIAFSNVHYYEGRLTTFPSSVDESPRLGVSLHPVPDGIYDKGRTRTNRPEAEALVAELVARLRDPAQSSRSFGVVTFSIAQQGLVEDLLEKERAATPEIERYFDDALVEPVFVKNLENVQGDERDVILLSVCYGPDAEGRVSMNFGPLNRQGGERRLNVAITRAREQVLVFSSMGSEQVDLARTGARGAADLKDFLAYAERGTATLDQALAAPDAFPAGGLESSVRSGLEARGWTVREHVGCSGYRLDLAVADPEERGRFLAAVEADGRTYAGAPSARDRDVTRSGVLAHLGWHLERVWMPDWWQDPGGELDRLDERLRTAAEARRAARAAAPSPPPTPPADPAPTPAEEAPPPTAPAEDDGPPGEALGGTPYRTADLGGVVGEIGAFYEGRAAPMIQRRIEKVIAAEAPISRDLLVRRVAACWDAGRITKRLRERVGEILVRADNWRFGVNDTRFLWRRDQDPEAYEGFRYPGPGDERPRRAPQVPPKEVANAAARLLEEHVAIGRDDLVRETARVFGFRRLTAKVRASMESGLDLLLASGGAHQDGDVLRPGSP